MGHFEAAKFTISAGSSGGQQGFSRTTPVITSGTIAMIPFSEKES